MKTKITYLMSCIMMLGFFVTKAQSNAETRTEKILTQMTSVCNLTPDQQTKMKAVILENENQREADVAKYKGDTANLKAAAKARNQKTKQEALAIVSQAQYDQWIAYRKQKRADMEAKREARAEKTNGNQ